MTKFLNVDRVSDYEHYVGHVGTHPLVSVIPYATVSPIRHSRTKFKVYGLFLRDDRLESLTYGMGRYEYGEGTLIAVAPGQVGGVEDNGEYFEIRGWGLLFHPDVLRGTPLENRMSRYSFFDYHVNEALHMTTGERATIIKCLELLQEELPQAARFGRNEIVVNLIELVLNHCRRFHERQFATREAENKDVLVRFEEALVAYYREGKQLKQGLPTVKYCSDQVFLSTNYFGDLVKKQTGRSPKAFIQEFIINKAKSEMIASRSVGDAAFKLGFEYPQAFSRFFKLHTGQTPLEFVKAQGG
ncbi:MAG: AraC family transcriptional regulator [Flavobacteriales bacterium]|jgi:AraC-like DNA-binding protein|nr:hypothetical protein [Flavobacteriales bacterium]MCC6575906.1 AraC family transcriptional regulator [Flavobacteriales bacterium]NUQ14135.1 AraC family transcriptional regulator [Flavobacteriales bacterium]